MFTLQKPSIEIIKLASQKTQFVTLKFVVELINGKSLKTYNLPKHIQDNIDNHAKCIDSFGWIPWVGAKDGLNTDFATVQKYSTQRYSNSHKSNAIIDTVCIEWVTGCIFENTDYNNLHDYGHSGGSRCWTERNACYMSEKGISDWFLKTSGPFGYLNQNTKNINHLLQLLPN